MVENLAEKDAEERQKDAEERQKNAKERQKDTSEKQDVEENKYINKFNNIFKQIIYYYSNE